MPEERGYTRQVAPRATAPRALAQPEAYGAGLGRQLEQSVRTLHRNELEDYAIERRQTANEEWARFQHDFGVTREQAGEATRESRDLDAPGHVVRVGKFADDNRAALLEGITDDEIRRRAGAAYDEWGVRLRDGEAEFEDLQGVNRTLRLEVQTSNIAANRIRRLDNAADYATELALGHDRIEGYEVPEDRREAMHQDWDKVAAVAFLRGQVERDPKLAKAMLTSEEGLFDNLDPDVVEALLNGADVEIRRQDAAAEHANNVAVADFRAQVRVAKEQASQGIDNADELPALIARARELGLEDVAVDLEGVAADAGFAKIYEAAPPPVREARMAELAGKENRTDAEDRELAWLRDKQGALDSRFNRDPAGALARTSTPPPPLDFADPASVAARARWAAAASEATGRPVPPLTANEAAELGARWNTGQRAAQLEVMDALAQLPAPQAAAAARMAASEDPRLAVLVTLPQSYRQLAIDGIAALKAKPKLVSTTELAPDDAEAIDRYDGHFAEALQAVPPAQRHALLRVAAALTAGAMDQDGAAELNPTRYWQGLNMALGGRRRPSDGQWIGGLGRWGDHWFLLPDGVTGEGFGRAANRTAAASEDPPVNPDGSPVALRRAFPVMVENELYEFRTEAGDVVKTKSGAIWRVRVREQ